MPKLLVTGGTGYIGSHTVVELQSQGYEVVVLDNLSNSKEDMLDRIKKISGIRPLFEKVDCSDFNSLQSIFEKHGDISVIIHFAAYKAVGESVFEPLKYYRNNLDSLMNILQLMIQYNVKNIVFSSSCTVYGQPDILPVTESDPIKKPLTPYGNTKKIGEEIITDTIRANCGFKGVILRYFNPIGAHPSGEIGEYPNGVPNNLLPFITQTASRIRKELCVFGNDYNTPDGSCVRDYISVMDLAKAHVLAVKRIENVESSAAMEIFNISTGKGLSVFEILTTFEKVTGVGVPFRVEKRREGDIEQVWADPTYANQVLGWKSQETLEATLMSAWNWEQKLSINRK